VIASIQFYEVIVFVHVASIVIAFGSTFGFGFFQAFTERLEPRGVPVMWTATEKASLYLVTPVAILAFATGLYLTIDAWSFADLFVNVGIVAIIVLLGLVHGFFIPRGRRALRLAERDIAAATDRGIFLSDEYWAVSKRIAQVGALTGIVILVAIFFMVVKP
jgi:hypothetical protein